MLLLSVLIALIALHTGAAQVATAGVNHEQTDQQYQQQQQQQQHQKEGEARQLFGSNGFNANGAFSSNFGSSSFGLNLGGPPNANANQYHSGNYNPTTTRAPIQHQQTFPNYNTPNNFNSLNSITNQNSHKKEPSSLSAGSKPSYNDYNQKPSATRVIDRFDHHYPDGSYEYRYELTDGTARYERGYFLLYDNKKTLVVVGYYSYRMPDGRYITVFYNADQNGYRQNQSITPQNYPNLPRSIDVPQFRSAATDDGSETSTPKPKLTTTTTKRSGRF